MNTADVRHIILDQPLSCWGQMMTAAKLAEAHGATLHLTAGCIGEPRKKHPGMSSSCMPRDPVRGYDRCRHDLAELRRGGAIDITDDIECWTPDGSECTTCHGARGNNKMAVPDEYPLTRHALPAGAVTAPVQGALW